LLLPGKGSAISGSIRRVGWRSSRSCPLPSRQAGRVKPVPPAETAASATPGTSESPPVGVHKSGCRITGAITRSSSRHWPVPSRACSISSWHDYSPFSSGSVLSTNHGCATFGTLLLIAGLSGCVRRFSTAFGTYAVPARTGRVWAGHLSSSVSSTLWRSCSIFKRHNIVLLSSPPSLRRRGLFGELFLCQ